MATNWIPDLFASIDEMNSDKFVSFMTDDAQFIFGNYPPAVGKQAAFEAVDGFFKSIKAISHSGREVWEVDNVIFTRGTVTYTRHNDTTLTVNFLNLFRMEEGKIKIYEIFIDNSELYK